MDDERLRLLLEMQAAKEAAGSDHDSWLAWLKKYIHVRPTDEELAAMQAPTGNGKVIRGKFHRGPKRDHANDPRWKQTPTGLNRKLLPLEETILALIWKRNKETYRARFDKTKRISVRELADQVPCGTKTAQRVITRLVAAGELLIVTPSKGNVNGAIYAVPPRKNEHEVGTSALLSVVVTSAKTNTSLGLSHQQVPTPGTFRP
jgi:hypothetical protein